MRTVNTSTRLKSIMKSRGLRQVDILELTEPLCKKYGIKMNKSDISQYVSGKVEPSQEKLVILGMALGVNEAWLMGFDVPCYRNNSSSNTPVLEKQITNRNERLLMSYSKLNSAGQKKVDDYIKDLLASGRYQLDKMFDDEKTFEFQMPSTLKVAEDVIEYNASTYEPETIAAHHEGDWSKEELEEVEEFKKYVKDKDKNK